MKQPMDTTELTPSSPSFERRDPAQFDDQTLVAALVAGDERAWVELLRRHGPTMKRCITSVTSRFRKVASPEDEQDIFATVCLRLLQNDYSRLSAFDPERGCSLSSWLGTITVRATYDFLRKHKRDSKRNCEVVLDAFESSAPDPFDQCLTRERSSHVNGWMQHMQQRDRIFLEQVCTESADPKQLATEMGISVATVYSKKHKLLARLSNMAAQEPAYAAA